MRSNQVKTESVEPMVVVNQSSIFRYGERPPVSRRLITDSFGNHFGVPDKVSFEIHRQGAQ